MSFRINLSDRSKVSARFIRRVHREIQKAFSKRAAEGVTQQQLALKLDVHRATVNKRLLGQDNLTLRSIADLAWALDHDINLEMTPKTKHVGSNIFKPKESAILHAPAPKALTQSPPMGGTFAIKQADVHSHG